MAVEEPKLAGMEPPDPPKSVALEMDDDFRDLVRRIELLSPPRMRALIDELKRRLGCP